MSVNVQRFLGYRMICTKESLYRKPPPHDIVLLKPELDKFQWHYDWDNHLKEHPEDKEKFDELKSLGFILEEDINDNDNVKDYITFIYDGFNGEYTWLIYVMNYKYDMYNLEDENQEENDLLKKQEVPKDIQKRMRRCYEIIFDKTNLESEKKDIFLQNMAHFV